MKKISILLTLVLLLVTCVTGYRAEASGDYYVYREIKEGDTTRKVWLKNGEQIVGNPDMMEKEIKSV